jgi:pyridoxal biosynthesis lyase PdxS
MSEVRTRLDLIGEIQDQRRRLDHLERQLGRIPTSTGTPTTTPADGALVLDTANDKLFARSGGVWKSATVSS